MRQIRAAADGQQIMVEHTSSLSSTSHDEEEKVEMVMMLWALLFGFQGGKWLSAHIEDLRAPSEAALSLEDALAYFH